MAFPRWKGLAWAGLALALSPLSARAGRPPAKLPLRWVADVRLPGNPTRMDYLSLDPANHRVYLAHMGDGAVIAVDTQTRKVLGVTEGLPRVRGVLAVPSLGKVYASAAGSGEVGVIDAATFKVLRRIPAGNVDGLDWVPSVHRLFVTDQHGGREVVVDTRSDRVEATVPLGPDVGNTRFDATTGRVLIALGASNELVAMDPARLAITGRYPLPGLRGAHGLALDPASHRVFVAGEDNATVGVFDLTQNRLLSVARVGRDVDVMAVDAQAHQLYVASESGVFSIFDIRPGLFAKIAEGYLAPDAHVVGVDPSTHLLYVPLQNVQGHPTLRILIFEWP